VPRSKIILIEPYESISKPSWTGLTVVSFGDHVKLNTWNVARFGCGFTGPPDKL
jgi:hypothetical protein